MKHAAAVALLVVTACAPNERVEPPTTAPVVTVTTTTASVTTTVARTTTTTSTTLAVTTTTTTAAPMLVELASEATGLAGQLTDALRTIRDPSSPPAVIEAAGERQQLVLRRLAAHPEWQADALAAVGDDVRAFASNDVTALNAPGDRALAKPVPPLETLPVWTIRAPLPADELLGYYHEADAATGIPWQYLAAINLVETRMGRIVGLSSASAIGPMQFLRSTWDACCAGDPTVDRDAIIGAAVYLRRRGGPADMGRAILGYNPNDAYRVMIERYAANMAADERVYLGYHAWQVFVATTVGPIRLPVGFSATERVPAADYLAAHPEDRA